MMCRLLQDYIQVILCNRMVVAKWYASTLMAVGYNVGIQEKGDQFEVCVLQSTNGHITLEDTLTELFSLGYNESQIIRQTT